MSSPMHYGLAQEGYRRIADASAHDSLYGRVEPAIIRHDYLSGTLVVDLAEYAKTHHAQEYCREGYLTVTYTRGTVCERDDRPRAYASVDRQYVRRASALARFRALGGKA